ncbi:glycosyltransferase family 61 protein [Arthrobacter pigmenti]
MNQPLQPRTKLTLDQIGLKNKIDQSSLHHKYLGIYEKEISTAGIDIDSVALISGVNSVNTANTFAEWLPNATIYLFAIEEVSETAREKAMPNVAVYDRMTIGAISFVLTTLSGLQLIIEDGTNEKSHKRSCFRELFFHLDDKGIYVSEDLHATYIDKFNDDDGEDVWSLLSRIMHYKLDPSRKVPSDEKDDKALAAGIRSLTSYGKLLFITKAGSHVYKLREYEADMSLTARYGASWGRVIETLPATTFKSSAVASTNRPALKKRFRSSIEVPEMNFREYKEVSYARGQVLFKDSLVLPDTFRHPMQRRLYNRFLQDTSPSFAKIRKQSRPTTHLPGRYFYLDTEYPAYYGHVTTEIISRLWAWSAAKELYPDLKAIVSPKEGSEDIPAYERRILGAFGIADSDIVCVSEPAVVESMLAATPMFANPIYVHPSCKSIWDTIRDNLRTKSESRPAKIFVNRPTGLARECRNGEAVVDVFRSFGFEVIYPEKMPLGDQVDTFAKAEVVAGFGGSGMLNSIFSDGPGTKLVIAPETYNAANEYLISSVNGDSIHYLYGESEIQHPPKSWTWGAYRSPFSFDFDRDGQRLKDILTTV